jgi:hypothetical protein
VTTSRQAAKDQAADQAARDRAAKALEVLEAPAALAASASGFPAKAA